MTWAEDVQLGARPANMFGSLYLALHKNPPGVAFVATPDTVTCQVKPGLLKQGVGVDEPR